MFIKPREAEKSVLAARTAALAAEAVDPAAVAAAKKDKVSASPHSDEWGLFCRMGKKVLALLE